MVSRSQRGPLEVHLMVGEYRVIDLLIQYSIPRITGWAPMMDHAMEQSLDLAKELGGGGYTPKGRGGGFFDKKDYSEVPF